MGHDTAAERARTGAPPHGHIRDLVGRMLPDRRRTARALPTPSWPSPDADHEILSGGRTPIAVDGDSIERCVEGRRVLLTGGGGWVGAELCRQLAQFSPADIVVLDRDESMLECPWATGSAVDDPRLPVVADIRDRRRIDEIFELHRPQVVFHAAALHHLVLLETHPDEGWKTNVEGTANLLAAAERIGVERFVTISSDLAADPTSVLGRTKRLAERLTATSGGRTGLPYMSVRFGNVLGSRGSLVESFRREAATGGPITVPHPDATRSFVPVDEIARLVIQAAALGAPGEALVIDTGPPQRLDDIARRMAAASDQPVEIVYSGLRPGERLHEVLVGSRERCRRREHPLISHIAVPPLHASMIGVADVTLSQAGRPLVSPAGAAIRSRV